MRNILPSTAGPRHERGVTLIESLVTMVVVSIGLLSIAGLQLKSLQYSSTSYHRSEATIQSADLVERLWAGICVIPGEANAIRDDWRSVHSSSLPGWAGDLDVSGNVYSVTVSWDERIGNERLSFEYSAILPELSGCAQP
ncbi:prepilin-type N-terminal cleavage/methylation domain-containing protein [Thiocapsa rosea]|uniref:type IV pilus modification PilV family protein n=1 Tax=Thiocapsa rosea TaxID=69360 RepID=UPI000EACF51A